MCYVISAKYIKYARIRRVYSGRKWKAAGFLYIQGSPYRDAEGPSKIRSCIYDAMINAATKIGQRIYKL